MRYLPLLACLSPLQNSNSVAKLKRKGLASLMMLSLFSCAANSVIDAQETSSVPKDLKLEELFGEPTGDAVRWLANFLTKNPDWALSIDGQTVVLHSFRTARKGAIEIPRLAAMVESISGKVRNEEREVKLEPLLNSWKISWDLSKVIEQDDFELIITMKCNDRPVTLPQAAPIVAAADGVIRLPAHLGSTSGASIRYEPQPFKNTIGWWASANDAASWSFSAKQPGRYSIAVLYGCGAGQGGSSMQLQLQDAASGDSAKSIASKDFNVKETGHFQNFQWQTIGEVEIPSEGRYQLKLQPTKIAKSAAMDVREVQLVRQAK